MSRPDDERKASRGEHLTDETTIAGPGELARLRLRAGEWTRLERCIAIRPRSSGRG